MMETIKQLSVSFCKNACFSKSDYCFNEIDKTDLYEFCLEWSYPENRERLIKEFRDNGWDYVVFFKQTESVNWFLSTMSCLKDI